MKEKGAGKFPRQRRNGAGALQSVARDGLGQEMTSEQGRNAEEGALQTSPAHRTPQDGPPPLHCSAPPRVASAPVLPLHVVSICRRPPKGTMAPCRKPSGQSCILIWSCLMSVGRLSFSNRHSPLPLLTARSVGFPSASLPLPLRPLLPANPPQLSPDPLPLDLHSPSPGTVSHAHGFSCRLYNDPS